jgi:hypothetical protein
LQLQLPCTVSVHLRDIVRWFRWNSFHGMLSGLCDCCSFAFGVRR